MLAYLCMLTVFGIFGNKWESRKNSNVVVSEQILISHISLLIERNIHEYLQILTPFLNIPVLYISHTDPLIGRTNGA